MTGRRFETGIHVNAGAEGVVIQQTPGATAMPLQILTHDATPVFMVHTSGEVTAPMGVNIGAASKTEIEHLAGVSSNVQDQIDLKAPIASPTFTGTPAAPTGNDWEMGADDMSPEVGIAKVSAFAYDSTGSCPITSVRKIQTSCYPKLVNPWRIETAPGWSSLLLPVYWEPNPNYDVVPAIVHTDFYHTVNVVLNLKGDTEFMIKFGTPIMQIIPFKRSGDFENIYFRDESDFKYVSTKGFGMGHISPRSHTAAPYRRQRMVIDNELAEQENKSFLKKLFDK